MFQETFGRAKITPGLILFRDTSRVDVVVSGTTVSRTVGPSTSL